MALYQAYQMLGPLADQKLQQDNIYLSLSFQP